ncbi:antibiotic synthesis protein MbtH [Kitasatospora sp. MMS16-BH015]|uniref:MbtH family protein n=1 Tax=Kitasatospora sp. MMS16-BH015 TaxID=2018025 RepID=UPI000CA305B9|nr:MbtH family NRPS accessory protein [Kitasatospora sp. MMS16-BH015]AUG75709.1 antibiotic synthesis protein MbtH [Kitasatospora sp. MMS16-BH015]
METVPPRRDFQVVVNEEEQYALWPEVREVPAGWRPTGYSGPREACQAHVDELWQDMRPLSLRRAMAARAQAEAAGLPGSAQRAGHLDQHAAPGGDR